MSQDKNYTEDKLLFSQLKSFVRARKVRYKFLCEEMGYSEVYLSKVFNGHSIPSNKFRKLLFLALAKFSEKDSVDLMEIIETYSHAPSPSSK